MFSTITGLKFIGCRLERLRPTKSTKSTAYKSGVDWGNSNRFRLGESSFARSVQIDLVSWSKPHLCRGNIHELSQESQSRDQLLFRHAAIDQSYCTYSVEWLNKCAKARKWGLTQSICDLNYPQHLLASEIQLAADKGQFRFWISTSLCTLVSYFIPPHQKQLAYGRRRCWSLLWKFGH